MWSFEPSHVYVGWGRGQNVCPRVTPAVVIIVINFIIIASIMTVILSSSSSRSQLGPSRRSIMARRMACFQRLAGTDPVSLWSWSVQDNVSSPSQVNDLMLGQLGNVGHCVLKSPE